MHLPRLRRRPSASMAVALLALFVALGGAGYAATFLAPGSVGTAQLQNASVTNHKILNGSVGNFKLSFGAVGPRKMENGAVGSAQINSSQVQARVTGTCTSGAVTSVTTTGAVVCQAAPGAEFDTSATATVTPTPATPATPVASEPLPGGSSYLVSANPYVQVTGAPGEQVTVSCTLTVGPATTAVQTRSWTAEIGAGTLPEANSIPLEVTAPANSASITAAVACTWQVASGASTPKVTATSNINAIQTASNTTH